MKITFLGAAKTVTGSCYLVETDKTSFIVDCGMFQGRAEEEFPNESAFPFNVQDIDFMLLTHAHIDHSGRIPKLYKDGYKNNIYTTKATLQLCEIMLPDSGHIQEMENEWQNRKNERAGKKIIPPIYTSQDATDCLKLFEPKIYNEMFDPADDVKVRFTDAGHILGSAMIEIWITENNLVSKIVFSGDIGNKNIPIMRDPSIIEETDYLVMESTYGDRLHEKSVSSVDKFVTIVNETISKGGNVIIPSFAVGRTQEIIYEINKFDKHKAVNAKFLKTPVYVDSPLAVSATMVFRENTDCYDDEAKQYITNGDNPLDFPNLHFTESTDDSKALNEDNESKIIISASGMCDAGRIKHHLKHNLWRKDSTIIFVGFQAEGTLGRKLVDGAKQVKLFGEEITVNARIEMIEGFSGHADLDGLLSWISAFKKKPMKIYLVHGEGKTILNFSNSIKAKFNIETYIPTFGESVTVGADNVKTILNEDPQKNIEILQSKAVVNDIDAIQENFKKAINSLKADMSSAMTPQDFEKINARIKALKSTIETAI